MTALNRAIRQAAESTESLLLAAFGWMCASFARTASIAAGVVMLAAWLAW